MITQIELTNHCNLLCKGCQGIISGRAKGLMDIKTFKKSIDICLEMNIEEVWLQNWGEPLLFPNLINFIEYASKKTKIGFISNGSLLTEYNLSVLKEAGLSNIDLSINGSTPLDLRYHNIRLFKEANALGLNCWIRSVIFNEKEYEDIKKLQEEENIRIRYQRGMIYDKDKKRTLDCPAIDKNFIIYWDGSVVPCCQVANLEICYGNIFDLDIINRIYKGIKNIHNSINIGQSYEICKSCFEVNCNIPINYKLGEK
jgi:radical SAM protein with 4Fe4S-binding SPASM domain